MATLELYKEPQSVSEEALILEGHLNQSGAGAGSDGGSGHGGAALGVTEALGGQDAAFNTLDEPIGDTVWRDVKAVGNKFRHVLYPVHKKSLLRDWDLWGPLILCTFMATVLQGRHTTALPNEDGGPEFAEVFVIVWLGALVVTMNIKLLGGHISFFQSVCVLGYCLLPLALSLATCRIVLLFATPATSYLVLRMLAALLGLIWATFASIQFLGDCQPDKRKALAAYPIFLFYFVIAWMVVSHAN